jgi:uncharacterized FlaG/YvyC family protein
MRIDNISSNVSTILEVSRKEAQEVEIGPMANKASDDIHFGTSSDRVIDDEMLDNAINQANKNLERYNKIIERTVHEKTGTIIYVLKDALTNEVIKEFPPRKIQDMIANMWELAGILVDERR